MLEKMMDFFSNDKNPVDTEKIQKRNKFIIFIGIFVILLMLMLLIDNNKSQTKKYEVGDFSIVNEDKTAKTRWVGEAATDLKIAKKRLDQVMQENTELKKQIKDIKSYLKNLNINKNQNTTPLQKKEENNNKNDLNSFFMNQNNLYKKYPKPSEVEPKSLGLNNFGKVPKVPKKRFIKYSKLENTLKYEKIQTPEKKEEKKPKKDIELIPTGTITKVILLSGMDAPTMTAAKTSPLPVIMKVVDMSILPNRWKYNLKECFITGEGYGDLSSERAYIRTNNLSCVTDKGKHIDLPFKGMVTGEDGKLGLRGKVVTKQGALLARTLIAGFLQGVGEAFKQENQVVLTGTEGTTTQYSDLSASEAIKTGAFSGLSKASEKLADFYLKMADQVAPVIEISAGRIVDVVATDKVLLKTFEDSLKDKK